MATFPEIAFQILSLITNKGRAGTEESEVDGIWWDKNGWWKANKKTNNLYSKKNDFDNRKTAREREPGVKGRRRHRWRETGTIRGSREDEESELGWWGISSLSVFLILILDISLTCTERKYLESKRPDTQLWPKYSPHKHSNVCVSHLKRRNSEITFILRPDYRNTVVQEYSVHVVNWSNVNLCF